MVLNDPVWNQSSIPQALYKFRPLASEADRKYAREIVVDHKLYFPSPLQFNDPFDAVPAIVMGGDRAARRRDIKALTRRVGAAELNGLHPRAVMKAMRAMSIAELEQSGRQALNDLLAEIGLCSMSANREHVLMWAHYASSHTGICLGFQPHPFDEMSAVCRAFKVSYGEDRPRHNPLSRMEPGSAFDLMLHKAAFWEYEEEWRLVRRRPMQGPGHEPFDRRRLTSITFGVKTTPEDVGLVREWVRERGRSVDFYRAVPDELAYRLRIEPYPLP